MPGTVIPHQPTTAPTSPFHIRPAQAGDARWLPPVERSSGAIFRAVPGLEWIADDAVQPEARHRALIAGGHAWVAVAADARDDGDAPGAARPVGFLNGERFGTELHLWEAAVHRDWQRRGIGRALVEAARLHAGRLGLSALTLTTFRAVRWNEDFYRSLGFVRVEETALSPRLRAVLEAEAEAGLPRARRCAMRQVIPPADTPKTGRLAADPDSASAAP